MPSVDEEGVVMRTALCGLLVGGRFRLLADFPTRGSRDKRCGVASQEASMLGSEDNCRKTEFLENGNIRNSVNFPASHYGEIKQSTILRKLFRIFFYCHLCTIIF